MFPINTILFPTDFSEQADQAQRMAEALARDHGAHLVILHVMPPPPVLAGEMGMMVPEAPELPAEVWERLNDLKPEGVTGVERFLVRGEAASEIVRMAREQKADLIVMGTHGRTGLGRLLMGSVAECVVRRAACPVLTVKVPTPVPATRAEREPVLATPF
jgi:nucleotide-binding universal stress UspA family protein